MMEMIESSNPFYHRQKVAQGLTGMIFFATSINHGNSIVRCSCNNIISMQCSHHQKITKLHRRLYFIHKVSKPKIACLCIEINRMSSQLCHCSLKGQSRPCGCLLKQHNKCFVSKIISFFSRLVLCLQVLCKADNFPYIITRKISQ